MMTELRVLESNKELAIRVKSTRLPVIEYRTWQMKRIMRGLVEPYTIRAKILFPPNAHLLEKLPVMVHVYGGPGFQERDKRVVRIKIANVNIDEFIQSTQTVPLLGWKNCAALIGFLFNI
jgi:hypothetical protein